MSLRKGCRCGPRDVDLAAGGRGIRARASEAGLARQRSASQRSGASAPTKRDRGLAKRERGLARP
jgi:hypothetical protein